MRAKNMMSIVLAGLLVFANAVCACPSEMGMVSNDANPHAHHQSADVTAGEESTLCLHQDCENCQSITMGAVPDRDGKLDTFSRIGLDDNVVWVETASFDLPIAEPVLARVSPHLGKRLWRAETPVDRSDLLLE